MRALSVLLGTVAILTVGCSAPTGQPESPTLDRTAAVMASELDTLMRLLESPRRPATATQAIPLWVDLVRNAEDSGVQVTRAPSSLWLQSLDGVPDYRDASSDYFTLTKGRESRCVALILALPGAAASPQERQAAGQGGKLVKIFEGQCEPLVDEVNAATTQGEQVHVVDGQVVPD